MGCPSGPVVSRVATLAPKLLVVVVLEPVMESDEGGPPELSCPGVGVDAGGRLLGVELGLG